MRRMTAMFAPPKKCCLLKNPSSAKRLRSLEDANGKLKKLLAKQMLDNAMLRDINSKKW